MSVTTNGQLCFGIAFDEDAEFPWNDDAYAGDIEAWWLTTVCGYQPSFEIYDDRGEYLGGARPSQEMLSRYFDEKHAFTEAHPLPVALVNYCSGEYPLYALAVPSSLVVARRGYPTLVDPAALTVTPDEKAALLSFCAQHRLPAEEPRWLLTSYWG